MLYDAVEVAYTAVNANFATDMAALASAKSVTCVTTATIVKRQPAEIFVPLGASLPAVGIWALRAVTQAKYQVGRLTETTLVLDYYASGSDQVVLAKQAELAAEALLRSIDRMATGGSGAYGAGEADGSVRIEMSEAFEESKASATGRVYTRRAQVTFTLHDEDTGL